MNHRTYWPGTNIPKSRGNAFDLDACPGELAREFYLSQIKADAGLKGAIASQSTQIRVFSKAVASKTIH